MKLNRIYGPARISDTARSGLYGNDRTSVRGRFSVFSFVLIVCLLVGTVFAAPLYSGEEVLAAGADTDEVRGVWVASVFNLNYPSKKTADPETLKADAIAILDNCKDLGFNTVILQVRPCSDSFYPSDIFPWSMYLTGTQGKAPNKDFDPLEFWIDEAHKRGLKLHAWINPYRITATAGDELKLAADHPALAHPEWTVLHTDGKTYWDPGEPGAQALILDGVREIVNNYDVDGLQIDDYFYPGTTFDDADTFAAYGAGYSDIKAWRRSNTEYMVASIYEVVKASGGNRVFGVSPSGIWANKTAATPQGSNTNGAEAYAKYADTRAWVKKGLMDFIAPQIYWEFGHSLADYETLANWWMDVTEGTDVDLHIAMAAYRALNTNPESPWYGTAQIENQLIWNRQHDEGIKGYSMYSYAIFKEPEMQAAMKMLNGVDAVENPSRGDSVGDDRFSGILALMGKSHEKLIYHLSSYWDYLKIRDK